MMQNDSLVTMQKEMLAFALVVHGYHVYHFTPSESNGLVYKLHP